MERNDFWTKNLQFLWCCTFYCNSFELDEAQLITHYYQGKLCATKSQIHIDQGSEIFWSFEYRPPIYLHLIFDIIQFEISNLSQYCFKNNFNQLWRSCRVGKDDKCAQLSRIQCIRYFPQRQMESTLTCHTLPDQSWAHTHCQSHCRWGLRWAISFTVVIT